MTVETAQLAGIIITVGALLPLITSVVEQQSWNKRTRTIVGLVVSTLAGLVTYVAQFGLDFSNTGALVSTIVGVILASGAAYKTVWEPSGIAPGLERKSSPTPTRPDSDAAEGWDEDDPEIDEVDAEDIPEDVPDELDMPPLFDDGARPDRP